jgi:hypothetical protein
MLTGAGSEPLSAPAIEIVCAPDLEGDTMHGVDTIGINYARGFASRQSLSQKELSSWQEYDATVV